MENSINLGRIRRKTLMDDIIKYIFLGITIISAMVIVVITIFISVKGITPFFKQYNVDGSLYRADFIKFIFGNTYFKYPNIYGAGYLIINTILTTLLALVFAIPLSVLTALFIAKIANKYVSKVINAAVELLSSIPSVIYGLFGMAIITKIVNSISNFFHYQSAGGLSFLSVSIVLAIMITPTITMISTTAIKAVKKDYVLGSLALGASTTQTNFKVVLVSAKSGIFSGIILGVGKALGEATAISLVCGNRGNGPTFNPFDTTKTLTSAMLQSIHESEGLSYDIRFSIGILLIVIILVTNLILNKVKNSIGEDNGKRKKQQ